MQRISKFLNFHASIIEFGLLLVIFFHPISLPAEVCEGNFELSSQSEVDNFNCTSVTGNLWISGSDITDLDGLSGLNSVGNRLDISNNDALANINGLSALTSMSENSIIRNNDALTNVDGLSALTSVDDLDISDNAVLTNVDGLASLTSVKYVLYISENPALTNISGLVSLTSIGDDLIIFRNDALTNVDGLESLTSIGGRLVIGGNYALTNINGLASVTSFGGWLVISDNFVLTNVDGLASIASVGGWLIISNNDGLTNIDGLAALTLVGSMAGHRLEIVDNDSLMRCCGIYPLLRFGEVSDVNIYNRPYGCTLDEILAGGICPDLNAIIIYFDARVNDETIEGAGKKPFKNLNKFRNNLESAKMLIEKNKTKLSCNRLRWCYNRSDGFPRQKDLIRGEAVLPLAEMINEVMINLNCNFKCLIRHQLTPSPTHSDLFLFRESKPHI